METIFFNGVRFSVEYIKTLLAVVYILDIPVKKNINKMFGISLTGVAVISYWINISDYGIFYWGIIFFTFLIALYKKSNIGFVILSYMVISIADMIFAVVGSYLFHLTIEQLEKEYFFHILLNSISLLLLILYIVLLKGPKKKQLKQGVGAYLPVIILSGISVAIYLTHILLIEEKYWEEYYKGLVISAFIITVIYFGIGYILLKNQARNQYLKIENDMNQRLLQSQNEYYSMMLKKEKETKMFRHDMKGHLICIQMLYEQEKYQELGEYLKQMNDSIKELSPKVATGNVYIDMILADLMEKYQTVAVEWTGKMPDMSISSMDVCTLFYNLMKNAFESADKVEKKTVKVIIKTLGTNLFIGVSNGYEELKRNNNGEFLSTKKEKGHGYGLKNIEKCVKKYKGSYTISTENGVFGTEIILPNVMSEV